MRVIVQRVKSACCYVNNIVTGKIDKGLMLLVSFTNSDNCENVKKMAKKIVNLRIFDDVDGKLNNSLLDYNFEILSISQFTLYADATKGNRPSFVNCMAGEKASKLYDLFNEELLKYNIKVEKGIFGANMELHPICDGPVTISLEI